MVVSPLLRDEISLTMTAMRVDAKVVMLGKESVGKTSLVERYVHQRFLVGPYQNVRVVTFVFVRDRNDALHY